MNFQFIKKVSIRSLNRKKNVNYCNNETSYFNNVMKRHDVDVISNMQKIFSSPVCQNMYKICKSGIKFVNNVNRTAGGKMQWKKNV